MSIEAMKQALEALENTSPLGFNMEADKRFNAAKAALRTAIEAAEKQEPVANEVQLNIIRYWPDDFAVRLESMWKDLIGFIPNYKLYDLQKMLAEFGFTMVLYEGNRPQAREWVGLTDQEINSVCYKRDWTAPWTNTTFARAIEAKLREKNGG